MVESLKGNGKMEWKRSVTWMVHSLFTVSFFLFYTNG